MTITLCLQCFLLFKKHAFHKYEYLHPIKGFWIHKIVALYLYIWKETFNGSPVHLSGSRCSKHLRGHRRSTLDRACDGQPMTRSDSSWNQKDNSWRKRAPLDGRFGLKKGICGIRIIVGISGRWQLAKAALIFDSRFEQSAVSEII